MERYACSVLNCHAPSKIRHRFPKIQNGQPTDLLLEWVRRCGNPKLRWQDTGERVVCHKHFHPFALLDNKRVKKGCVPALLLPIQKPKTPNDVVVVIVDDEVEKQMQVDPILTPLQLEASPNNAEKDKPSLQIRTDLVENPKPTKAPQEMTQVLVINKKPIFQTLKDKLTVKLKPDKIKPNAQVTPETQAIKNKVKFNVQLPKPSTVVPQESSLNTDIIKPIIIPEETPETQSVNNKIKFDIQLAKPPTAVSQDLKLKTVQIEVRYKTINTDGDVETVDLNNPTRTNVDLNDPIINVDINNVSSGKFDARTFLEYINNPIPKIKYGRKQDVNNLNIVVSGNVQNTKPIYEKNVLYSTINPMSTLPLNIQEYNETGNKQSAIQNNENNKSKILKCRICRSETEENIYSITQSDLQYKIQSLYPFFHVKITENPICCHNCKTKIDDACQIIRQIKESDRLIRSTEKYNFVKLNDSGIEIYRETKKIEVPVENYTENVITIDDDDTNLNDDNTADITDADPQVEEEEFNWDNYDYGNKIDEMPDIWYEEQSKKQPEIEAEAETTPIEQSDHDYTSAETVVNKIKILGYRKVRKDGPSIAMPHAENGVFSEAFDNYLKESTLGYGRTLWRHIRQYIRNYDFYGNGPYLCHLCGQIEDLKKSFQTHNYKYHTNHSYNCKACKLSFDSINKLNQHKRTKHPNQIKQYKCNICFKIYKHKIYYKLHMAQHKDISEQSIFSCEFCGKEFPNKLYRDRHSDLHTRSKSFQCQICTAYFYTKGKLRKHIQRRHELVGDPLPCTQCRKNFMNPTSLQKHIDIVHNKTGGFKCEHCQKCFWKSDTLRKHLIREHKVNVERYQCEHCPNLYFSEIGFNTHMLEKHWQASKLKKLPVKEKEQECEFCSRKFASTDELIEHKVEEHTELFMDSDNEDNVEEVDDNMDTGDYDTEPDDFDLDKINPSISSVSPKGIRLISDIPINVHTIQKH